MAASAAATALAVMASWLPAAGRAGETALAVAGLPDPVVVWTPEEYDDQPGRHWPVVYWYPGTGGRPSVDLLLRHTGGEDWILVGMGFRDPGRFQGDEANIAAELAILRGVREQVERSYRIRPGRSLVGGFSKGGWVSGLFLIRDPSLDGALILGAGLLEAPPAASGAAATGAPPFPRIAYLGIGEVDGNRAMSQRAARELPRFQVEATLDVWEGRGHDAPERSEALRQWLRCAAAEQGTGTGGARIDPVRAEAVAWFDREFGRLTGDKTTAGSAPQRYFALERLIGMPFFAALDEDSRSAATQTLADWSARPELAAELAAQRAYGTILDRESRDRRLGTLAGCCEEYRRLSASAPGTVFGAAAARAARRAGEMLKASGVVP